VCAIKTAHGRGMLAWGIAGGLKHAFITCGGGAACRAATNGILKTMLFGGAVAGLSVVL